MNSLFNTPVLFLIFNRPDTTRQVFEVIRRARPSHLFIAADGPRPNIDGEEEKCQTAQEIVKQVDWDCEVKTLFRKENLGCKTAVSSAISWFFEHVEEGVILEDDCLPSDSFFSFCAELLEKYRNDQRVMMISGDNFQDGIKRGDASYYFSSIPWIWGWATWRRAWRLYDREMKMFPDFVRLGRMSELITDRHVRNYRWQQFIPVYEGHVDTWDYQWIYSILVNGGLTIVPNVNLIRNIGFAAESTHTCNETSKFANIPSKDLHVIAHPPDVFPNREADQYFYTNYMNVYYSRIRNPLARWRKILRKHHKTKKLVRSFINKLEGSNA